MLVTVNLLTEGLVSGAELLLCLRDGEWARVGRDWVADADIQEELARMIRMNIVLGRRPFVVLREKHEIGICFQIGTVDTFKASSILIDKSRVK